MAFNDSQCNLSNNTKINSENVYNKKNLRIVQYNVEWLFLNQFKDCPGSGCTWVNESEAEIHMSYVQRVVDNIQPDIINFCEVEGCSELQQLLVRDDLAPYLIFGTDTATGQNVGMISSMVPSMPLQRTDEHITYPLDGSKCGYNGSPGSEGVSKHYYTYFQNMGMEILWIGLHFLAVPTDYTRCAQREAQAQIIQNVIYNWTLTHPDSEIIVIGDLNDYDAEIPDLNDNKPTSRVLDILKGVSGNYAGSYSLRSVGEKVAQNDRFSDWWDSNADCVTTMNEFSCIDHVLMSSGVYSKIKSVKYYHEYDEYCGKYNSDHYPIIVDLEW